MIDPKLLRQSADDVARNLARRGFDFDAAGYLALDEKRKALQVETESLRNERNASAKAIGQAKAKGEDAQPLLDAVKSLGERLDANESSLAELLEELRDIELDDNTLGHIILVPTPAYRPHGDFDLVDGRVRRGDSPALTFAGLAVYKPEFVAHRPVERFSLAPLLFEAADAGRLTGEVYDGVWADVGTPERLDALNRSGQSV